VGQNAALRNPLYTIIICVHFPKTSLSGKPETLNARTEESIGWAAVSENVFGKHS
jgi:hypothetical protein